MDRVPQLWRRVSRGRFDIGGAPRVFWLVDKLAADGVPTAAQEGSGGRTDGQGTRLRDQDSVGVRHTRS